MTPVEIIGAEAVAKLEGAGYLLIPHTAYTAWAADVEDSKARIKKIAEAAIRAADTRVLIVEINQTPTGLQLLVCDPARDERKTIEKIGRVLKALGFDLRSDEIREHPGPAPSAEAPPEGGAQ